MTKRFIHALLIQCITMSLLWAGNGNAQVKSIDEVIIRIGLSDTPIERAFSQIEKQTGYNFVYTNQELERFQKVTVERKRQTLYDLLVEIAAQTHLEFKQVNQNIHVKKTDKVEEVPVSIANREVEVEIAGTVVDGNGEPVPGVTVSVPDTGIGTATDIDGKYSLSVPEGSTLVFSFIGFETQRIPVGDQSVINVTLNEDMTSLDEVVVVGYGTQRKRDLTGSVGSVVMDEKLTSRPLADFGQFLHGKVAGISVMSGSGRPGESSTIQIRGVKSITAGGAPLIVVDGMAYPDYNLTSINSMDIESIDILKDAASTSIYGARGANGIILITTKSGEKSDEPYSSFNLSYTSSLQEVIRKIDVMNTREYSAAALDAIQTGWIESGGDPNAPNTIEARGQWRYTWPESLEHPEGLPDTDWQDVIFRVAPMHKMDMSFSGGNKNSSFRVSGGHLNQKGIAITSDYKRYTLGLMADSKVNERITLGGKIDILFDEDREPFNRTFEWAVQMPPIYPIYTDDGLLGGTETIEEFNNYDLVLLRAFNGHPFFRINDEIRHEEFRTAGHFYAGIDLLEGLNFETSLSGLYKRVDNSNYQARNRQMGESFRGPGNLSTSSGKTVNYIWKNLLRYNKDINGHGINFLGGYEYNFLNFYSFSASRQHYDDDELPYLSGGSTITGANDNAYESSIISFFGRVNYNYMGKYLLSLSFRRDGSSRFGPENKWGNFPAISAGWIISDEQFMESSNTISNLKIRASYGITGNDAIGNYHWMSQMNRSNVAVGNNLVVSYYPSSIENSELAWERSKERNLGINLGLINQRIIFEGDIYQNISDNLLLAVPVPTTSGYSSVLANIGEVKNKGMELAVTSQNLIRNLGWSTELNFNLSRSEVTKLGPDDAPMYFNTNSFGSFTKINKIGEAPFSFFGYEWDGVYMNQEEIEDDPASYEGASPGALRYKDVDGDGKITSSDRTVLGNYQPDYAFYLTNNFSYGNFDLSFMIQAVVGSTIYDDNAHRSKFYHYGRNFLKEVNNRWRSEDEPGDGRHPKLTVDKYPLEVTPSAFWLDDGTFFRLKDVTIGYRLPEKILTAIKVSNVRVFFNAVNLLTVQKAKGIYDPEIFWSTQDYTPQQQIGVSGAAYPTAKIYSCGINVEF
jgi:TonB-linked SusC/RagA family outer membrane protein